MIGTPRQRRNSEKYHCNIPWAVLMDPTSACNLHCTGCWAADYGNRLNMLGIPEEMFTPIFAIARIVGWSAHRIEELVNMDKIIRPAYKAVLPNREYRPMESR